MPDASGRPRRKRLSWESRCEIVAKVRLQGISPHQAAASSGVHRSTVYRLLGRFDHGGWAGLIDRRPVPHRQPRRLPHELEERILAARAASAYGPAGWGHPGDPGLDGRQGPGPSRLLAPPKGPAPRGRALRAGAAWRAAARGHQAPGALSRRGQTDPWRRHPALAPGRLATPSRGRRRPQPDRLLRAAGRPGRRASCAFLERAVAWFAQSTASESSACSPTTATPTAPTPGAAPVRRLGISAGAPGPTRPAPTARPRRFIGTLLREWAYATPTPQAPTAPAPCLAGCAGTTDVDPTAPLATGRRSAVSRRSVVTSPREGATPLTKRLLEKRTMGLEPTTFGLGSRRSTN